MTPQPEQISPPDPERPSSDRSPQLMLLRIGLAALLIIAVTLVGSLLFDVRKKLAELSAAPQENLQWTLTQLEVEFLNLSLAVARSQTTIARGEDPNLARLRQRYDIVFSRVETLRFSQTYEIIFETPDLSANLLEISAAIKGMAPRFDADNAALAASINDIDTDLAPLRQQIRTFITGANQSLTYVSDASRTEVSNVLYRLALASLFLLIVLVAMVVIFRRLAMVSNERLKQNLATSARLEAIFSTSRDGIAVIEADGAIVNLNRAGTDMFGRPGQNMRGARIGTLLFRPKDDDLVPVTGRELFDLAKSGRTTRLRLLGKRTDGTMVPVEMSVDISSREAVPICVCVIRDITQQTAIEAELKSSRDQALAAERAKARFLGVVSHEMRTPLNGILGTLDLIDAEHDPHDPTRAELTDTYLPVLRRSSETLLTLVNDVLDITQIESGVRLVTRSFDLDQMLADLVLSEAARAQAQGNAIEVIADQPVGHVTGDPERLRQILANLLVNAIKFTRDGAITIEATRLQGDEVEIQIIDTGQGMTQDELDRVFDDFVRTDHAIDNNVQGTGLGLGIAKTFVEAMNGQIGAESEPEEGSVFWIRLPLPPALPAEHGPDSGQQIAAAPPTRVLLVEDNETNRFIARRLLENDGHSVTEATNGAEALEIAGEDPFDIILMDISMPVMNGLDAARHIREGSGPNRATRIVALTAHVAGGLDETATRQVMDAVLHKPLNRNRLIQEIANAHGMVSAPQMPEADSPLEHLLKDLPTKSAQSLIDRFIAEADRSLAVLPGRLEGEVRDTEPLAAELHDTAGAFASFGQKDLHHWMITAESAVRDRRLNDARTLVTKAVAAWPAARAAILGQRPQ